jgi:hypothetical protein
MRYYIDDAWHDNQGDFLRKSRPTFSLANPSGEQQKLYK